MFWKARPLSVPGRATLRGVPTEDFRYQGFDPFLHGSLDSQLGSVISPSMVGASDNDNHRFIEELLRTSRPGKRLDVFLHAGVA